MKRIPYKQACKELELWARADNYIGPDLGECFTGPGRTRDSQSLEESNFFSALERLGGEREGVEVHRFGHWGCGWFEQVLVHKSNKKAVIELYKIKKDLENYPVLDDLDYSEREGDDLTEYVSNCHGELDAKQQRAFIDAVYDLGCDYTDADGSIYIRKADVARAYALIGYNPIESK